MVIWSGSYLLHWTEVGLREGGQWSRVILLPAHFLWGASEASMFVVLLTLGVFSPFFWG